MDAGAPTAANASDTDARGSGQAGGSEAAAAAAGEEGQRAAPPAQPPPPDLLFLRHLERRLAAAIDRLLLDPQHAPHLQLLPELVGGSARLQQLAAKRSAPPGPTTTTATSSGTLPAVPVLAVDEGFDFDLTPFYQSAAAAGQAPHQAAPVLQITATEAAALLTAPASPAEEGFMAAVYSLGMEARWQVGRPSSAAQQGGAGRPPCRL
jgi:hypothetical protein